MRMPNTGADCRRRQEGRISAQRFVATVQAGRRSADGRWRTFGRQDGGAGHLGRDAFLDGVARREFAQSARERSCHARAVERER